MLALAASCTQHASSTPATKAAGQRGTPSWSLVRDGPGPAQWPSPVRRIRLGAYNGVLLSPTRLGLIVSGAANCPNLEPSRVRLLSKTEVDLWYDRPTTCAPSLDEDALWLIEVRLVNQSVDTTRSVLAHVKLPDGRSKTFVLRAV